MSPKGLSGSPSKESLHDGYHVEDYRGMDNQTPKSPKKKRGGPNGPGMQKGYKNKNGLDLYNPADNYGH